MFKILHNSEKTSAMKFFAESVIKTFGHPCRQMTWSYKAFPTIAASVL